MIAFLGGGGKTTLMNRIAREAADEGKRVLVTSTHRIPIPPDVSVALINNPELAAGQLKNNLAEHHIVYMGKEIENNQLCCFDPVTLVSVLSKMDCDHIFIDIDENLKHSLTSFQNIRIDSRLKFNRWLISVGTDSLNKDVSEKWIEEITPFWQDKETFSTDALTEWIVNGIKSIPDISDPATVTVYLNKVENTFSENMVIPLVNNLVMHQIGQVAFGSVYQDQCHIMGNE